MSNNYSDTHAPLIINKMSKAKYDELLESGDIQENELYLVNEDNIDANSAVISNVGNPVADADAANKLYVDEISAALNDKINAIGSLGVSYNVVAELPSKGESGIIYLVPTDEDPVTYKEYLYLETTTDGVTTGQYELIGSTETDLTNYATLDDLAAKQDKPTSSLTQYGYGATASNDVPIVIGSNAEDVEAAQIKVTNTGIMTVGGNQVAMKSEIPAVPTDYVTTTQLAAKQDAPTSDITIYGNGACANKANTTAIGSSVSATVAGAIALGSNKTKASGNNAVAVGNNAQSTGLQTVAVGVNVQAKNTNSTAIGYDALATNMLSFAAGSSVSATGAGAIAIGGGITAVQSAAIAIGTWISTTSNNSITIGNNTKTGTILNPDNTETSAIVGESAIALGKYAYAQDDYTIAIGASKDASYSVSASAAVPIVIGSDVSSVSAAQITVTSAGVMSVGGNPVAMQSEIPANIVINNAGNDTGNLAIGDDAKATGDYSIATGPGANASCEGSIAIGCHAQATCDYSIATGNCTQATGVGSIATGFCAQAEGYGSIATGSFVKATGSRSIATGNYVYAKDDYTIAIGTSKSISYSVSASTAVPIVIGSDAEDVSAAQITVTSAGILNVGGNPVAMQSEIPDNIVTNNTGSDMNNIAIGCNAKASGSCSIAIGGNAYVSTSGCQAMAFGNSVSSTGSFSIATGVCAQATNNYSIATGYNAQATSDGSIATGYNAQATNNSSIAIGCHANATSEYSIATGVCAQATNNYSIATGYSVSATGNSSIAIGTNAQAIREGSIATGVCAQATRDYSIAIGPFANATNLGSIAIGCSARAVSDNTVAIGTHCHAVSTGDVSATANTPIVIGSNAPAVSAAQIRVTKDGVMTIGGKIVDKFETKTFTTDSQDGESDLMIIAKQENGVQPRLHAGDKDIHGVTGFSNESAKYTGQRYLLDWDLAMSNDTSYLMGATKWTGSRKIGANNDAYTTTFVQPLIPANTGTTNSVLPYALPCFENSPVYWNGHIIWNNSLCTNENCSYYGTYTDQAKDITIPWNTVGTDISSIEFVVNNNKTDPANGRHGLAIGYCAKTNLCHAVAIGACAQASGGDSIAIGCHAQATGSHSIAIGCHAQAIEYRSIATGDSAQATCHSAIAIGNNVSATRANSIAAGTYAQATGDSSIAIGCHAQATAVNSIATGRGAQATLDSSIAIGTSVSATGYHSIAIGCSAQATGCRSIVTGDDAKATSWYSIATGYGAKTGTILDPNTETSAIVGDSAIALGKYAYAQDDYTIAIGASKDRDYSVSASTAVPIVIGSDAEDVSAAQITVTNTGVLKIGNNEIANKAYVDEMIGDINTVLASI